MALGPLPDADHIIQARVSGTHNGILWVNTHYLQCVGALPNVADLSAMATSIGSAWNTNIAPLCHANVTMNQVDMADLSNRGAAIASVTALAHPGTRAGSDNANQIAMVVSWKANRRFKGGHPRSYLPAGVQADILTGRLWVGTFQTLATTSVRAYRTALNALTSTGATYRMVYMRFITHDPVTKAKLYVTPPEPYTITDGLVHGRVDTQRRRLGKETP